MAIKAEGRYCLVTLFHEYGSRINVRLGDYDPKRKTIWFCKLTN